ncbi:MAG: hypothetical protein ACQEQ4_05025 [Fibrobacterota bacterium]
MTKTSLSFLCIFFLLLAVGCSSSEDEVSQETSQFTDEEGRLGLRQIQAWKNINPELNSLSQTYIDSLSDASQDEREEITSAYTLKRDSICTVMGLSGGYNEYMDITRDLRNPEYRHFLDSLNLNLN